MSKKRQRSNKKNNPRSNEQTLLHALKKAKQLYAEGHVDEALEILSEIETQHPFNADISYEIALYSLQKSSSKGIQKLKSILKRFPDHAKSLLKLGDLYLRPGYIDKASPYFKKALELYPNLPASYIGIGTLEQRKGNLPIAVENYRKALKLQLENPTSKQDTPHKDDFKVEDAEKTMWKLLALMCENGVHMFPSSGTLLGIVRDGQLMSWDKDIDVGLPFSEMDRAVNIIKNNGWVEANNSFGYINPRAFIHQESGLTVDLVGFTIDKETHKPLAGMWIAGIPKEWNRLLQFENIKLVRKKDPFFKKDIWFPEDPECFLETVYGNWKVPDKDFDSVVRAKNLISFSYLAKCFAYSRIFSSWQKGNYRHAKILAKDVYDKEPNDILIREVIKKLNS